MFAGVPYAVMVSVLAGVGDWSVGWIWLAIAVFMALAMLYVHHERPGEHPEREQFAREQGLSYPVPPRKRRLP